MNINPSLTPAQNLLVALNAASSKTILEGDLGLSVPSPKSGADQSYENTGPNTVLTITGIEEKGFKGSTTRDYRRVPLDAPVGGALQEYTLPVNSTVADLYAAVSIDRNWHPSLTYTTNPVVSGSLGPAGATGTIVFIADPADVLHIGEASINYRIEDEN